jgi:hypothetical protein
MLRDRKWKISQGLLDKAEAILRLPLVRTRLDRDGTATIVEPVSVRVADAARLGDIAARLADESISDAAAEHAGVTELKIVGAVFRPPWLQNEDDAPSTDISKQHDS